MKNQPLQEDATDKFSKMDLRQLPPLKSLKGFEATARLSSVRGAAEELNLTHPAISHQIQTLEDSLAVKLFVREGRHIRLTDAGKEYYQIVRQALAILITGTEQIRSNISQPSLRVQTYITTSIRWLAPRLPKFNKKYPDIELDVSTYNANWDFDEKHADIAIIYRTEDLPKHLSWQPLFHSKVFPVCSPELLKTVPSNLNAEDLSNYPLISVHTENKYWSWEDWFDSIDETTQSPPLDLKILEVDTLAAALEMAVVGEGIALVNGPFADNDLASGRLVIPVAHQDKGLGEWGIVYHKNLAKDQRVTTFIQWLLEQ
ncbi:MAG: LysR substrate-binding domain-containing protein [Marinomonas sp.]